MAKKQFSIKQIIIRELPYKVLHLLIARNILSQYLRNFCNNIHVHTKYVDDFTSDYTTYCGNTSISKAVFNKDYPKRAIDHAFYWTETPEGHNFWKEIEDEL